MAMKHDYSYSHMNFGYSYSICKGGGVVMYWVVNELMQKKERNYTLVDILHFLSFVACVHSCPSPKKCHQS